MVYEVETNRLIPLYTYTLYTFFGWTISLKQLIIYSFGLTENLSNVNIWTFFRIFFSSKYKMDRVHLHANLGKDIFI